ncbi:DNA primase [Leuconostoc lactis]|uniref:DNA primase n=1 Tax=Leuconostoc lactis TaxID=1246 RepID=UPI0006DC8425|nr:DNA primase [Leuconostoc lactis]KQB81229.1 DNA primase [Leuconostoc lactis]QEA47838.1 DNA primase [Leuconostoc lactis]HBP98438.1 DNA primase [Leuconostoc lactis]
MASRIPDAFIDEVRKKVNIVDVIGEYTQLVKRGRQWNGSCPFHDDRHPSLFVEENKQVFNCFSCGRSGSVFSFIMEKEGLSYPEAVLSLAEKADMPVDQQLTAQAAHPIDSRTQAIYDLHSAAQRLYQHILLNTTSGETALAYLHDKRQLSDMVIKQFGIGFVPDDNVLLQYAKDQNIAPDILQASELFITNDQGVMRDRFAGRIVWPIKTARGQVVGFSGRALASDNTIKYMNSPESPFFTKGKILYNFDRTKNQMRQTNTALIFEGFMDVISADMAGKTMGVATMGTALTPEHVQQLARVAQRILLVYDGDEAGQKAAKRAIDLIRTHAQQVEIGVVHLPDQLDPDDLRIQRGTAALQQALEQNIQTPVEFLVNAARTGKNLSNQVQYLAFLQEVMQTLQQATPVEQDLQLTKIANEFGTSKQALQAQLQQTLAQNRARPAATKSYSKRAPKAYTDQMVPPPAAPADSEPRVGQRLTKVEQAERALLMAMIKSPQVLAQVKATTGFAFVHPDYQLLMMLAAIYQGQHPEPFDLAQFMDFIQKPALNQKIMAIDRAYGDLTIEHEAIRDYLQIIMEEAPIEARVQELQQLINVAKQQHDDTKLLQLMTELINLKKQHSG